MTLPGGWSATDSQSEQIETLTKWAIKTHLQMNPIPEFFIVYAYKQVVAGMNYRIGVDIFLSADHHEIWEFTIYDRFGVLTLVHAEKISA
jgi:hypothetical protein